MASKKKLPPKNCTPTKAAHDEILSSLLRINNFDSISSIKDESLDIDLSACVTISPAGLFNTNSLSSIDFWRVLDESAQNAAELNTSENKEELSNLSSTPIANISSSSGSSEHQGSELSVTFLRPEPPNAFTYSPFKKNGNVTPVKCAPSDQGNQPQQQQQPVSKIRLPASTTMRLKVFKEEPPEDLPHINENAIFVESKKEDCDADLISSAFSIFHKPNQLDKTSTADSLGPLEAKEGGTAAAAEEESSVEKSIPLPEIIMAPTYKCLDCNGLILASKEQVAVHEAASHRTRVFYKCSECEREFDLLAGLKKHLKTHRTEGRKDTWKKCPDCGKCLKLGSMWMHRKIHTDNKKYVCEICGQKFVQKINLTHHARIHSSEKPYECPECQKRFQERSHLQRHQKYHAQTRSYRCEKCGKMYKTERCLKVHNLVHLEQRPFACNVCDKSFISNSKLKQHSNIHTGMRPFKCNYCPRDFTNFPNWLKHTRRRHKVDHKTGEQLENIPSYCSKKSTTKAQKAAAAAAAAAAEKEQAKTNGTNTSADGNATSATSATMQVEVAIPALNQQKKPPNGKEVNKTSTAGTGAVKTTRKKKQQQQSNPVPQQSNLVPQQSNPVPQQSNPATQQSNTASQPAILTINTPEFLEIKEESQQQMIPLMTTMIGSKRSVPLTVNLSACVAESIPIAPPKQAKAKRERKQPAPKQLQKLPPTDLTPMVTEIKEEPLCEIKSSPTEFLDVHGLSLTSAEELIMEQALEMEECGLYDTPVADIGTDNAISAEAAAALHFQVKSEITDDKDDDFLLVKKNEHLTCPSLESSPFSSPASIELSSVPSTAQVPCSSSNYYMSAFAMNTQGAITTNLNTGRSCGIALNASNSIGSGFGNKVTQSSLPTLLSTIASTTTASSIVPSMNQSSMHRSLPSSTTTTTTLATATNSNMVNMPPLLVRPNQMLPSVDTLLFSTNGSTRFYASNKSGIVAQQSLSSSSSASSSASAPLS